VNPGRAILEDTADQSDGQAVIERHQVHRGRIE
jgi:hypothetical protein